MRMRFTTTRSRNRLPDTKQKRSRINRACWTTCALEAEFTNGCLGSVGHLGRRHLAAIVIPAYQDHTRRASVDLLAEATAAYSRGDYTEAKKLYRRAAEQGNARAQSSLASIYSNGKGVLQDYAEAAKWNRRAADQGDVIGQSNYGVMYIIGQGVPQDYVQAYKWFDIAASRNAENREAAEHNRDTIAKRMTPAQIAEAQKLAPEWKPTK